MNIKKAILRMPNGHSKTIMCYGCIIANPPEDTCTADGDSDTEVFISLEEMAAAGWGILKNEFTAYAGQWMCPTCCYPIVSARSNPKPAMKNIEGQWFYTDEIKSQSIEENGCNCDSCCSAVSLENSIRENRGKTDANQPIK